jgi:tRNA-Thr(GGU) m(6)t(6)A37 methyltransferase TsaA
MNMTLQSIGIIHSQIKRIEDAPKFYTEGAPDAELDLDPAFAEGLFNMKAGDEIIVVTWLHKGDRSTLKVHPRGDPENPITGVFLTRSPNRPNPLGLHRTIIRSIEGCHLQIGAMEVVDGTPVVDIKPVVEGNDY